MKSRYFEPVRLFMKYAATFKVSVTVAVLVLIAIAIWAVVIPPFFWLPEAGEAEGLLSTFLAAQGAITALTIAVTVFVIQGASTKRDVDDRVYREYIQQSLVGRIFFGSLLAVGITSVTLLLEIFLSAMPALSFAPGMRNLVLVAVGAFILNLILPAILFRQSIHLSRPENWQDMRRSVNERDVQEAVGAFLTRHKRMTAAQEAGEFDFSATVPDRLEGSANEALRSLLDDGRRAMVERRLEDAKTALNSIKELIGYAVEELESSVFEWGDPGSQPQWPPLREVSSNIYSFRKEVISRGDVDLAQELLGLDYWCISEGLRRSCGDLFTVGLTGCQHNYEIASEVGNEQLRKLFGEQFWGHNHRLVSDTISQKDLLYSRQLVSHLEYLLNNAMQSGSPANYQELHESIERCIRATGRLINSLGERRAERIERLSLLEQYYRIALMGLGGRAALLASSGAIDDPSPYLDVVRRKHNRAEILADDTALGSEACWHERPCPVALLGNGTCRKFSDHFNAS